MQLSPLILTACRAEQAFLLGWTQVRKNTTSIFSPSDLETTAIDQYYILVLISSTERERCASIQNKVESVCASFVPTTALVMETEYFANLLSQGNSFARSVATTARCLVGNVQQPTEKSGNKNVQANKNELESLHCQGLNKVAEFLAGAELYRIRRQNQFAAFMLHQAAEQALLALFRLRTGLTLSTHNLDKLIRYCAMVAPNVADVFSKRFTENNRLLQLLQKAYIEARYRSTYQISQTDLAELTHKVRQLQTITKEQGSLTELTNIPTLVAIDIDVLGREPNVHGN